MTPPSKPIATDHPRWVPVLLGAFLGLALLKFGNPVILDAQVGTPSDLAELWIQPWPLRWSLPPLLALFAALLISGPVRRLATRRPVPVAAVVLPSLWLSWQFLVGQASVDPTLTHITLAHFTAVVACYLVGFRLLSRTRQWEWLLAGLGVAVAVCWLRAINQHLVEFPQDHATLLEGQQNGWTNFPPSAVDEMRHNGLILRTNGVEVANPAILEKLRRGRVYGTLVYPNALAGCVLLLLPLMLAGAMILGRQLRPAIRHLLVGMISVLGLASLFWSGSKSGWLIALAAAVVALFRLPQVRPFRRLAATGVVVLGLGIFGARFSGYFAKGATSVSARLDYWRAAVRITAEHPGLGTGPGTFQRPYARLKHPDAEMARLTHNDYLEQFCDSGVLGGGFFLAWMGASLVWLWRKPSPDPLRWAATLGVTAWLAQNVAEFGLYVPGLSWTGFTLLGVLAGGREIAWTPGGTVAQAAPKP